MKKIKTLVSLILIAAFTVALTACGGSKASGDYTFKCVDENGNAVAKVKVQACTDTLCRTGDSDADGIVTFTGDTDSYEVHVLKVPDGYEYTGEDEFTVSGKGSVTEITFSRK